MDYIVLGSFAGYLALMLGIGFFFSRKQESLGDYYLGGRKMNKWVVALSAQASDMSGWLLMGLPGAIYVGGFSEAWIGIGLLIGTYLNWKIVAHRLRRYSQACGDSITIPDFICNRFRDKTGISRILAALIILVFFTFYTASGFVSCAKLFTTTFGVPEHIAALGGMSGYTLCLWIGAVVVVSYTLMGGYMAVCWTDFIQGALMFIAIVIVPAIVVCNAGGFASTVDALNEINPYLQSLFTNASTAKAAGFIGLASCMAWGLGYFGMPHILVRFMSIDNPAEVKGSRRIAMSWVTISLGAAVVIGLVFHLFLKQRGLTLADVGGDPEKCFMIMINGIFSSGFIARVFAGILLSAIMAAIMSTADSPLRLALRRRSGRARGDRPRDEHAERVLQGRHEDGVVRLGRIRRVVRSAHPPRALLAQGEPCGRGERNGRRRDDLLRVEVRPRGLRGAVSDIRPLRARPRLPPLVRRHRARLAPHG